jgi:TolA-binding protein
VAAFLRRRSTAWRPRTTGWPPSSNKASRQSGADIGIRLSKTIEDVAMLRGQVETYLYKINELETALAKTLTEVDAKVVALQGSEAVKAAEAKRKAQELERPTDKKEFLSLAKEKAKAGELVVARQLYQEFLKKWSKDALVSEAHYGLGETYFNEERCREALYEYGRIIQEHGKSSAAAPAYLRSSDCFAKLKMKNESRLALEELVKAYPKSDAAKTAKTRLAALDKAEKKGKGKSK